MHESSILYCSLKEERKVDEFHNHDNNRDHNYQRGGPINRTPPTLSTREGPSSFFKQIKVKLTCFWTPPPSLGPPQVFQWSERRGGG